MRKYVLGFVTDPLHKEDGGILVVQKTHPPQQKGLFNGPGGKVRPREGAVGAMVRKFKEEVGLPTRADQWRRFATISGNDWSIACFAAKIDGVAKLSINYGNRSSPTEEEVYYEDLLYLFDARCVPHFCMLAALSQAPLKNLLQIRVDD